MDCLLKNIAIWPGSVNTSFVYPFNLYPFNLRRGRTLCRTGGEQKHEHEYQNEENTNRNCVWFHR